jgi:hypothetical protein
VEIHFSASLEAFLRHGGLGGRHRSAGDTGIAGQIAVLQLPFDDCEGVATFEDSATS